MPLAVTDAYATIEEYRSVIRKSDPGEDADVGPDLLAVSRWLDRKLNRFFTRDAAPVIRTYYPRVAPAYPRPLDWAESENPWLWGGYVRWLITDDMSEPPSLVVIDQNGSGVFAGQPAVSSNDYSLWPENADKGPEVAPWTALFAPSWSTIGGFPSGKRVQVTCRWGWAQIPEAIRAATIQFTGIWRLESPRATTRMNELDQVVGTSPMANSMLKQLIDDYVRKEDLI